ncbi:putative secreted RxLR effector protein [Phytophthora cinnamomi]|uniref:putative secreted RxLR effector protein n=1 Tax=Phytophthora cinnamomi TaxID=4785 RepID=UPI00355A9AC1|nr:putative secreted RxLR effector protein [Phytophthora cinnamomi]
MRLSCVLFVAVAAFFAISDAASTADEKRVPSTATDTANQARITRRRHLRSYNMNDLEGENKNEERFQMSQTHLEEFAQLLRAERAQTQAHTINIDAILRAAPTREGELARVAAYFETHENILGGWLKKSTLDTLRTASPSDMKGTFQEWKVQGKTLENLTELLNAEPYVKKEYAKVAVMYGLYLKRLP